MPEHQPILLAEDNEDDIFLMRRAFREAGLSNPLNVVRNGEEVIWYLNSQKTFADRAKYPWPCLLLLDLKMPVVDGFEVLAWLQRRRRPKNLLVVILTSSSLDVNVLRALELGADAYLAKPKDFELLVGMVRDLGVRIQEFKERASWLPAPSVQTHR
jgi:CheY-like chemotaxis protein